MRLAYCTKPVVIHFDEGGRRHFFYSKDNSGGDGVLSSNSNIIEYFLDG